MQQENKSNTLNEPIASKPSLRIISSKNQNNSLILPQIGVRSPEKEDSLLFTFSKQCETPKPARKEPEQKLNSARFKTLRKNQEVYQSQQPDLSDGFNEYNPPSELYSWSHMSDWQLPQSDAQSQMFVKPRKARAHVEFTPNPTKLTSDFPSRQRTRVETFSPLVVDMSGISNEMDMSDLNVLRIPKQADLHSLQIDTSHNEHSCLDLGSVTFSNMEVQQDPAFR